MKRKAKTNIKTINKNIAILGVSLLILLTLISACSNISNANKNSPTPTSQTEPAASPCRDPSSSRDSIAPSSLETSDSSDAEAEVSDSNSAIEQDRENDGASEYILPESNTKYLSEGDLYNRSKEELRIARNEIYARRGRIFQSQDLQDYFENKAWYNGTIDPANFSESLLNDYEKANVKLIQRCEDTARSFPELSDLPDAPSKEIIDHYGYEYGYSVLSFHIKENSLKDCGEYYQIDATYQQGIQVPADLEDGAQISLVFNELTGETRTLVFRDNRFYPLNSEDLYDSFYCYPSLDGKSLVLYHDSEDRMDKPVYEGKLYIRKDATEETDIMRQIRPVTKEILNRENWYNGVYFDQKGYVTRLVYYGD